MNKQLSQAQDAVLQDIRRIIRTRRVCYSADLQHLDGRTINSLARRGFIRFRGFRVELVTV